MTVSAPKAPCRQTHTSVRVGHQGLTPAVDPPRRRAGAAQNAAPGTLMAVQGHHFLVIAEARQDDVRARLQSVLEREDTQPSPRVLRRSWSGDLE